MELTPGWLDYGTAGILVIVLVGVGIFFREILRKNNEKDIGMQKFMESMVTSAAAQQAAHIETLQAMTKEVVTVQIQTLAVQEKTVEALDTINQTLRAHCEEAQDRHGVVVQEFRNLRQAQKVV